MIALTVPEFVAVAALPVLGAGVLAVIDQRTTRIATAHAVALAVVTVAAVAIGIAVDRGSWWSVLAGAALWAVPLFLLAVAGGFGGGDFKYACSLGALAGWVSLSCSLTGLLLAVLVAALEGVALAVRSADDTNPGTARGAAVRGRRRGDRPASRPGLGACVPALRRTRHGPSGPSRGWADG